MDFNIHPDDDLTPEKMEEIRAIIEDMQVFLHEKRMEIFHDKLDLLEAGGGMTPALEAEYRARQSAQIQDMEELEEELRTLIQKIKDTKLVLGARLFEKAKVVHPSLREASKTDPSLAEIVQELDALYKQALEEQGEEDLPESDA